MTSVAGSPPVGPGDFPDPFVLTTATGYLAYGTNVAGSHVQVRTSPDLRTWTTAANALPELPDWAVPGFTWSPSVLARGDEHVLWYAVREPRSGRQVISVARGTRPEGPYRDRSSAPAVAQLELGGSIDPSPFVDDDGTAYLLWKADANALDRPSTLWAQRLADDGATLVGDPTQLLAHDQRWERPLIEAPSMVTMGGRYWLFYSGGWWESDSYATGYATADHPLGPWAKQTGRRAWLASTRRAVGPGGAEVFRGADGTLYLAYHAWERGRVGYQAGGARTLRIGVLDLSGREPALEPLPEA